MLTRQYSSQEEQQKKKDSGQCIATTGKVYQESNLIKQETKIVSMIKQIALRCGSKVTNCKRTSKLTQDKSEWFIQGHEKADLRCIQWHLDKSHTQNKVLEM